jgi:hypothetical protein
MWPEVNNGGRHGQQGIRHNMGEAPGQWQGLPMHQNDTAPPAFQGQALAGLNNAGAGPQGQEAPWVLVSNLGDWRAWQMHHLCGIQMGRQSHCRNKEAKATRMVTLPTATREGDFSSTTGT